MKYIMALRGGNGFETRGKPLSREGYKESNFEKEEIYKLQSELDKLNRKVTYGLETKEEKYKNSNIEKKIQEIKNKLEYFKKGISSKEEVKKQKNIFPSSIKDRPQIVSKNILKSAGSLKQLPKTGSKVANFARSIIGWLEKKDQ